MEGGARVIRKFYKRALHNGNESKGQRCRYEWSHPRVPLQSPCSWPCFHLCAGKIREVDF